MRLAERLQELEAAIDFLRVTCEGDVGVVVEGRRDVEALRKLGVGGTPWTVNVPGTVEDLVDRLAEEAHAKGWRVVVILTDWDRTGGRLAHRLHDGLVGRVPVDMEARRRLASVAHARCVEHIPGELGGLRGQVAPKDR